MCVIFSGQILAKQGRVYINIGILKWLVFSYKLIVSCHENVDNTHFVDTHTCNFDIWGFAGA